MKKHIFIGMTYPLTRLPPPLPPPSHLGRQKKKKNFKYFKYKSE